jgi:predicted dehydrogenase
MINSATVIVLVTEQKRCFARAEPVQSTRTLDIKVKTKQNNHLSRRQFLRTTTLAAGAAGTLSFPFVGRVLGANDRVNVACIGVGGKGSSDCDDSAHCGANIVALCDVDEGNLRKKAEKYPDAKHFRDFRKMLDQYGKSIDAVTVSIPDHNHGIAAATAMRMGKHVYCQKPLTQTVYEARLLRKLAKDNKVATQMGNQGSANPGLRRAVEVIQAGLIGPVRELHVWSNRPIWPQGIDRPPGEDPIPSSLDWDQWIGPAHMRPFKKGVYHAFNWRGWKEFGTGALGDMACHTVNMPFRALKLGYPNVVELEEQSDKHDETYPKSSRIRFEFPEREDQPALKFWWYDGNPGDKQVKPLRPSEDVTKEILAMSKGGTLPSSGCLLVGDKGKVFSPDDYGAQFYFLTGNEPAYRPAATKEGEDEALKGIPQTIPRSPGHNQEWFNMIKDGTPAYSNFDIAAYLTEIILLGCIANRVGGGRRMEWDGPNMRSPNIKEASNYVKREYRKGWEL